MSIYQFMSENPWLTVALAYLLTQMVFRTVNRIGRHWGIHKHGYPPAHCDADGDAIPQEDKQ